MIWDLLMYEGWVGDGQIVLSEPGEELCQIGPIGSGSKLARVSRLQALQVASE